MDFRNQLKGLGDKITKQYEQGVREVVKTIHSNIVKETPVLEGHLKRNNQVSLGDVAVQELGGVDITGDIVLGEAEQAMTNFKAGQRVTISNAARYAAYVEYGTEKMTPRGFFRRGVMDGVASAEEIMKVEFKK